MNRWIIYIQRLSPFETTTTSLDRTPCSTGEVEWEEVGAEKGILFFRGYCWLEQSIGEF